MYFPRKHNLGCSWHWNTHSWVKSAIKQTSHNVQPARYMVVVYNKMGQKWNIIILIIFKSHVSQMMKVFIASQERILLYFINSWIYDMRNKRRSPDGSATRTRISGGMDGCSPDGSQPAPTVFFISRCLCVLKSAIQNYNFLKLNLKNTCPPSPNRLARLRWRCFLSLYHVVL